jgi:hypothetical protein
MDKATLLGTTAKGPKTGQHSPDRTALREPFADRESAVRYHCTGCGFTGELTLEVADEALGCHGIYKGSYISCDECSVCGEQDLHNATLKAIEAN